jgi:hypothetical protein
MEFFGKLKKYVAERQNIMNECIRGRSLDARVFQQMDKYVGGISIFSNLSNSPSTLEAKSAGENFKALSFFQFKRKARVRMGRGRK